MNADPARSASPSGDSDPAGPDWAEQIVDVVDSFVSNLRSKTTDPVARIGEFILLGFMVTGLALAALLLLVIALFKVAVFATRGEVWLSYLVLGGISFIAGLLFWPRRRTA